MHNVAVCCDCIDVEVLGVSPRQSRRVDINRSCHDGYILKHTVQGYAISVIYRANFKRKVRVGRPHRSLQPQTTIASAKIAKTMRMSTVPPGGSNEGTLPQVFNDRFAANSSVCSRAGRGRKHLLAGRVGYLC